MYLPFDSPKSASFICPYKAQFDCQKNEPVCQIRNYLALGPCSDCHDLKRKEEPVNKAQIVEI